MTTTTFDPVAYKNTTRTQWQSAAAAWHSWGPVIEAWLGEATELMLDLTQLRPGAHVLDVAAGAGGQSVTAARRVGPTGRVLATDIAENLLAHAEREARAAGLSNVATRVMDGEDLDTEADHFDAVISRVGLIYFPDQQRALVGMRRALRPGGRIGAIVYSTPEANRFFSIPISVIRSRAQLPPPMPGQPGPFSLGSPGVLQEVLARAGFADVEIHTVPSPLLLPSAADCVRFERESFGALHQMLTGLDEAGRAAAWQEITAQLQAFDGPEGFVGPCEMLVAAATNPGPT
ncbi:MAG: class I SAM-dependent methyltransferase [Actinomycetota bacterium]|nr:class I SAM-dependent methyltransferase [Actinomycetota bacterium]